MCLLPFWSQNSPGFQGVFLSQMTTFGSGVGWRGFQPAMGFSDLAVGVPGEDLGSAFFNQGAVFCHLRLAEWLDSHRFPRYLPPVL